jgi:hypothetical protein
MLSSMGGVLETFVGREGRVVTWVAKVLLSVKVLESLHADS